MTVLLAGRWLDGDVSDLGDLGVKGVQVVGWGQFSDVALGRTSASVDLVAFRAYHDDVPNAAHALRCVRGLREAGFGGLILVVDPQYESIGALTYIAAGADRVLGIPDAATRHIVDMLKEDGVCL